jgi:hypothetical protein
MSELTARRFRVTLAWDCKPADPDSPWRVVDAHATYTLLSTDPDETIATVEAETLHTFHVQREDVTRLDVVEVFIDPESGHSFTLERA